MKAVNGALCQACWFYHIFKQKKKKFKKVGFPVGSDSKESTCNARDLGSVPGMGRSLGERNGNPLQYSYLEKSHEQGSLVGYSPWDSEEWDTTEQLTLSLPH